MNGFCRLCVGILLAIGSTARADVPGDAPDAGVFDFAGFQQFFSGASYPLSPDCLPHVARIQNGCLRIIGTAADTDLALRLRSGVPTILEIDVGNDGAAEFNFNRGLFACIVVEARGGDDQVLIDEVNGVFTDTEITSINGGPGDDTLLGGSGGETFLGGPGSDSAFMGAGADRFIWNPGDGTDLVEGSDGVDTIEVNGGNGAESFTVTANGTRVRFDRLNPTPFFLDIGTCEDLVLNANGGNDSLACTGNLAALIHITVDGGAGDDTLLGSNGADVLIGGDNNDFVDGNQGIDTAILGAGNDIFQWDPGDGNDTIEGQGDHDVVVFNGSNIGEIFDFSANGPRLRFTRNIANIVIDADGIEQFDLRALGGADAVTVNSLSGTAVAQVNVNLAGTVGGITGDAQPDGVFVNATNGVDTLAVSGVGTSATVTGPASVVTITTAEVSNDRLTVNALGGNDTVQATGLAFGVIGLTLSGGFGDDVLIGSAGVDILNGDDDNDTVTGGAGNDTALLGVGNDQFIWNTGDDADIVEGGEGIDTVEVNGGNGDEVFTVTANGTRVRFDRVSPAPFFLDIGTCEGLVLNANGGSDSFACTGNLAALILITADGGAGDDTLLGSNGADLLLGGDDNDFIDGQQGIDTAFLGAGDDTFQWDPGDGSDTVEGQAGHDVLLFNGSNIGEIFEFSANGPRLRFTRNVGSIVMDADDVEQFDLHALGGADIITVNELAGTNVSQVNARLAGTIGGGGGDGQPDNVIVNGTNGADDLVVAGGITGTLVLGVSAVVSVSTAEAASDRLTVNALGGDDDVQATGLASGVIGLTLSGGIGDDVLVGSGGIDLLNGDDDNDTIMGGDGNDTVQLGLGSDVFIWNPGDDADIIEGGDGSDIVEVNGDDSAENFTVTANGARVRFDRISAAPFFLDIGACEELVVNANGGNDTLSCTGNLSALIQITADGGAGDDTLLGSNGADRLLGGDDNDFIDGQQGIDVAFMGAGNDTFQWDPGDGSDVVEGQGDHDTLLFNGSAGDEILAFSANGPRLRFNRNLGAIVMDADGIEQFDLNALGGIDSVTVNDLSGTALSEVNIDLAGTIGGVSGDTRADTINVNGTQSADTINVAANSGNVEVSGLDAFVRIRHSEPANDALIVNGLGGVDTITSGPGLPALIALTINQ